MRYHHTHGGDDVHYPARAVATYQPYDGTADAYHEPAATISDYYEHSPYAEGGYFSPPGSDASQMYHEATDPHSAATASAALSVHAPRPVRCAGSPTFLTPEEQMGAFDAHPHHPHVAADARGLHTHHSDPMLISLAAADEAAAAQMSLAQVALISSSTDPTLEASAVE